MCYTSSVELTRMHWKTDSAERIGRTERLTVSREQKQLDEQKTEDKNNEIQDNTGSYGVCWNTASAQ